ncbi:ArnT family glycosyltransferase [Candidatus Omnitrophota bacterium]
MKKILFFIFILALFLRLFTVFTQEESKKVPYSDAKEYDSIAVNLVSGHGYSKDIDAPKIPTSRRVPVYPLFLASVYAIFGHSYMAVKIIQAILGALLCIVVFLIANMVYSDKFTAVTASFITAIYKPFVSGFNYYGGPALLLSEYFFMFILALTILTILFFIKNENKGLGALSGIFIGLTILTRPEFALYPILLVFYLFLKSQLSVKRFIKKYFIVYFFIALTLTPWIIRNYAIYKKFIPLSTLGGYVFLHGNNSLARGGWEYPVYHDAIMKKTENMSEYEKNRLFLKKGIEELKAGSKRIPKLFIKKILVHWAPFEKRFELFNLYYAIILIFGIPGMLLFRKGAMKGILLISFLTTTLTAVIIWGDPRYRYPYELFLIIFAAFAMKEIFTITQRKVFNYGK